MEASTSVEYLAREGVGHTTSATIQDALAALAGDAVDAVDAVVYDEPMLRYEVRQGFGPALAVLPVTFERQLYAIALPAGSPLREPLNRALLARTTSPDWARLVSTYLGEAR